MYYKEKFRIFTNRFVKIFSGDNSDRSSSLRISTTYPYSNGGDLDSMGYTKVKWESEQLLTDNTNLTKALALSAVAYSKAPEVVVGEFALELAA
jgi:hypothetical protein